MEIYISNAFSKDGKGGNGAGVVFDSETLSFEDKLRIAGIVGLSETAFISSSNIADFKIEYFTVVDEVPLCGHATIASFSTMYHLHMLDKKEYLIETKAGLLKIFVDKDTIFMQQNNPMYLDVLEESVLDGCVLGRDTSLPIQIVSTGLKDILYPVKDYETLCSMYLDYETMSRVSERLDVVGIHAFCLRDDIDAVCRNYAPRFGIDEESATGTSNCALASYLYKYVVKKEQFVFEQGYSMDMPSRIIVHLKTNHDVIEEIYVGGKGYIVEVKNIE